MSVSFVEMSEVLESIFDAFVEISVSLDEMSTVRIYIRCICRDIVSFDDVDVLTMFD